VPVSPQGQIDENWARTLHGDTYLGTADRTQSQVEKQSGSKRRTPTEEGGSGGPSALTKALRGGVSHQLGSWRESLALDNQFLGRE